MDSTIFKRPLFVNYQAYSVIPELYYIDKLKQLDLSTVDNYSIKIITTGAINAYMKKAGNEYLLHLDLYLPEGACELGEWYVKGITSNNINDIEITYLNNILSISVGESVPDTAVLWEDGDAVLYEDNEEMLWEK